MKPIIARYRADLFDPYQLLAPVFLSLLDRRRARVSAIEHHIHNSKHPRIRQDVNQMARMEQSHHPAIYDMFAGWLVYYIDRHCAVPMPDYRERAWQALFREDAAIYNDLLRFSEITMGGLYRLMLVDSRYVSEHLSLELYQHQLFITTQLPDLRI